MGMAEVTRTCVGCGEQFTFTVKRGPAPSFCTRSCYRLTDKDKATRKRYSKTDKDKASQKRYRETDRFKASQKKYRQSDIGKAVSSKVNHRRRARKLDAFIEDVDVRILLDIQGGACFLCCQPISLDKKYPDPMSVSIDHITPLARSGVHSYENCAATHLQCNMVKGIKSIEEVAPLLRLVL